MVESSPLKMNNIFLLKLTKLKTRSSHFYFRHDGKITPFLQLVKLMVCIK